MKDLLKYLGPIVQIIGVILLAVYYVQAPAENTLLSVAGILVLAGIVVHILLNKKIE